MLNESSCDSSPNFGPNLDQLNKSAFNRMAPAVEKIIRTGNKNKVRIGQTLDQLLRFCGDQDNLNLYRKLCGYLMTLDASMATARIKAYVEIWGPDARLEQSVQ